MQIKKERYANIWHSKRSNAKHFHICVKNNSTGKCAQDIIFINLAIMCKTFH